VAEEIEIMEGELSLHQQRRRKAWAKEKGEFGCS